MKSCLTGPQAAVIIGAAALLFLSGCAATPPPDSAAPTPEEENNGDEAAAAADGAADPAPKDAPAEIVTAPPSGPDDASPDAPQMLIGLSAAELTDRLGPPAFRYAQERAQIWRYAAGECVYLVYLYARDGEDRWETVHVDQRQRQPSQYPAEAGIDPSEPALMDIPDAAPLAC